CPFSPVAENFLTKDDLPMLGLLLRTIAVGIAKSITLGEYNRIKNENKTASDYQILIALLNKIATAFVIPQYYQPGRTSDGTAPLRIYTIVGLDGQIINIQGFDLMQTVKITVRHTNGTFDQETIDPSDAVKRIGREAGYRP